MRIVDASPEGESFSIVAVEHKGMSLLWDIRFYGRPTNTTVEKMFESINGYWASLPVNRQDGIYEAYLQIHSYIDSVVDANMLHIRLTQATKHLYDLMPFEEIRSWNARYGNVRVPPTIKDTYEELEISERNQVGTDYKALTYLRSDYMELVNLAIYLKPMAPIWAEYSKVLDRASATTRFREYQAMSVMSLTELSEVRPMERLRTYVEASSPDLNVALSAALGGLGSSEIPDWLVSHVIIRKLVLMDVYAIDTNNNIVSVIYHYIDKVPKNIERKFSGHILKKPKPAGEEDDENKSVLETYKIKQTISDGDLMVLSIYTERTLDMAKRICPEINQDYVQQALEAAKDIEQNQPTIGQLILLRWVLSSAISPKSIDNVNRLALLSCFAAAQSVLWQWGFNDLALLLTANEARDIDGTMLGGIESQARIPKEYVNRFTELYPHYQEAGGKKERQTNVACKAIDSVARDFVKCNWIVHSPKTLRVLGTNVDERGVMFVPSDIRAQLSALVVKLAEKQETVDVP